MTIRNCAEDIIVVDLAPEPKMRLILDSIIETVEGKDNFDAVVSFASVDIVTTSSLRRLLKLRGLLTDRGHRLVLCSLADNTRREFEVTALDEVFEFAGNKTAALAAIKDAEEPECRVPSPAK